MVNFCANPDCGKPLHYLRDGRVFVFRMKKDGAEEDGSHPLEHFWLCGDCAQTRTLMQDATGAVTTVARLPEIRDAEET